MRENVRWRILGAIISTDGIEVGLQIREHNSGMEYAFRNRKVI